MTTSTHPPHPITPKQRVLLDFIRDYIEREGHSPTYEQMAAGLKRCKVTAFETVRSLINKGYLHYAGGKHTSRNLALGPILFTSPLRTAAERVVSQARIVPPQTDTTNQAGGEAYYRVSVADMRTLAQAIDAGKEATSP